ncbi:MAG TPA: energy-coupling factor ABC transporter ATP-binding protein [Candidatus Binatia bacterium]
MSAFSLKDLQVRFEQATALDVGDLELPVQGLTLVTGPNGAGKTTLLRVLAGVQPPTRGTLRYRGQVVSFGRAGLAHRRRVTLVAQDPFLFKKKVLANVAFGALARGFKGEEVLARARKALEAMGCGHLAGRDAGGLSGGERRRVALARAVATGAEILLLDEPTAEVDSENSERLRLLITTLAGTGTGIIVSTHQPEWAGPHARSQLKLSAGRVIAFSREDGSA